MEGAHRSHYPIGMNPSRLLHPRLADSACPVLQSDITVGIKIVSGSVVSASH